MVTIDGSGDGSDEEEVGPIVNPNSTPGKAEDV